MNWIRSRADAALLAASCIFALLLFEAVHPLLASKTRSDNRYMLFSDGKSGPVFRNVNDFFTYQPNKDIRSTTYYDVNGRWEEEYDYFIKTNNFGLVQEVDLAPNVESGLLLGDSFTEGQGASPWFETFRSSMSTTSLQWVNGGFVGTGFQQWKLLHDFLVAQGVRPKHLIIVFISGDYSRGVWNMSKETLDCLADHNVCVGNENFYGMPDRQKRIAFLEKLKKYREAWPQNEPVTLKNLINYYLPATKSVAQAAWRAITPYLGNLQGTNIHKNRDVISEWIARYKDDVLFVHIPQREEIQAGRVDPLGLAARKDIRTLGGSLVDGHSNCGLGESDYHRNDGHPNMIGYGKISACVAAAAKEKWGFGVAPTGQAASTLNK